MTDLLKVGVPFVECGEVVFAVVAGVVIFQPVVEIAERDSGDKQEKAFALWFSEAGRLSIVLNNHAHNGERERERKREKERKRDCSKKSKTHK
jgi:hypothetical protein